MKPFPGMTPFVEQVTQNPFHVNESRGCSSLATAGDLIGQAYSNPANAEGILDKAGDHVESLRVRYKAAQAALSLARSDLIKRSDKP